MSSHKSKHPGHGQRPNTDCDGTSTRLIIVVVVYTFYVLLMLTFGFITHALVLISEGLHAVSDWFSYGMTLWFHSAQYRPPTPRFPFGWLRATVIGGLLNGLFLVALALFITLEAITRFIEPHQHDIQYLYVIIVGCVGLAVNIGCTALMWTAPKDGQMVHGHAHFGGEDHGHSHGGGGDGDHDLNIKGMLMHLLVDVCSSAVVLVSGLVGYLVKQGWVKYVDPVGAQLVAIGAVGVAIPLLRHCSTLLMQTPGESLDSTSVDKGLRAIPSVVGLSRPTTIWRLTDIVTAAECHLEVRRAPGATDVTHNDLVTRARTVFETHGVDPDYVTVEVLYDTTAPAASVNGSVGGSVGGKARSGDVKLELA